MQWFIVEDLQAIYIVLSFDIFGKLWAKYSLI